MRVHWTQNAVNHLVNIYEYIALNSHTYAKNMVDRITCRSEQIGTNPYRIIYRIKADQIDVLAVHAARLLSNVINDQQEPV